MKNNITFIAAAGCLLSAQLSADVLVSQEIIKDTDLIVNTKQWKLSGADFAKYGMCPMRITITNTGSEKATYQCDSNVLNIDAIFSRLRYREAVRGLVSYVISVVLGLNIYVVRFFPEVERRLLKHMPVGTDFTWTYCSNLLKQVWQEHKADRYDFILEMASIGVALAYWRHIRGLNNKLRIALDEIIVHDTVVLDPGQTITKVMITTDKH